MRSPFVSAFIVLQVLTFLEVPVVGDVGAEQTTEMNKHEDIVQLYEQTANKINELKWEEKNNKQECLDDEIDETPPPPASRIERIENLPTEDMVGVNRDMLHLCATVAGGVYDAASRWDFEKLLQASQISKRFPDLTVRFFQNGVTLGRNWFPEQISLNAPTFVGLITGSTLILGWRGTVTIKDILADANINSVAPWKTLEGLEVHKAYYEMIENDYFKSHSKDIQNYIKGHYSKVPNRTSKDGTPITKIILTGHSLGGGLAQVAHLCLRAPPDRFSPFTSVVKACENVEIKTIAISAPMTTVVNNPSPETTSFLRNVIQPDMRNVVFSADVVPRGYSDLEFIDGFVNAFLNDQDGDDPASAGSLANQLARAFVNLHVRIFKMRGMMEQAERYRHVGKLIYYDSPKSKPVVHVDTGFQGGTTLAEGDEKNFRELRYGPKNKVADTALENHMVLVTGPGLVSQT